MTTPSSESGYWTDGSLPTNVRVGHGTVISGVHAFKQFRSRADPALTVGHSATLYGVHFAIGGAGHIEIGDFCYFTDAILLCELNLHIGNYVVIGWNTTIADTDFHPIDPVDRIADAVACSPLARGRPRPVIPRSPVVIEDDVWIGPNATILKGVRVGRGAFIEAGSLVTQDVPSGMRVVGNPARVIGQVSAC
jgi:acetyltransferase-like isoleucine patch superfamily enzyme